MTHSLLYAPGRTPGTAPHADETILTALSLDRALICIVPDVVERRYLSALLAAPLTDAADIAYRQAVMRDFLEHPAMLPAWQSLFGRLAELRRLYEEDRRQRVSATARAREEALFGEAKSRLQMAALTLKRLLLLIGEMHERLSGYPVAAEGLRTVTDRLSAIARADASAELIERCGSLAELSTIASYRFVLHIAEDGRITGRTYLDRAERPASAEPTRRRLLFPRKPEAPAPTGVKLDSAFPALRRQLVGQGLGESALVLERICSALFAEFCPLARELTFYAAGVRFAAFFTERGLPTTLPDLLSDGSISGTGFYDPFLAATMPGGTIVSNDFAMPASAPGVLVTGANNSGKTVFLRSVGSAILLGQAGFPVCGHSAAITPVQSLTSVFAAAEKADGVGSEAGRFEEEVHLLSDAVDRAAPGELILLNEPFQTTAYHEGAEGLAAILRYLQAQGTRWILVTHLDALPPLMEDALRMVSGEDHRVTAV